MIIDPPRSATIGTRVPVAPPSPRRLVPHPPTQGTAVPGGMARPVAPQMCVVVSELADSEGHAVITNLRRRGALRVVLLARRAARREIVSLLAGGLRGAVATETIGSLAPGRAVASPQRPRPDLTEREISVLKLVAEGRSNRDIGVDLGLSALTVKSHLARISRKLGTGDRAALVAIAIRTGVFE